MKRGLDLSLDIQDGLNLKARVSEADAVKLSANRAQSEKML